MCYEPNILFQRAPTRGGLLTAFGRRVPPPSARGDGLDWGPALVRISLLAAGAGR